MILDTNSQCANCGGRGQDQITWLDKPGGAIAGSRVCPTCYGTGWGEARDKPCMVCTARRGIDKCRPDEELHVTHYTAEEMNIDPLPDKPCECGVEEVKEEQHTSIVVDGEKVR